MKTRKVVVLLLLTLISVSFAPQTHAVANPDEVAQVEYTSWDKLGNGIMSYQLVYSSLYGGAQYISIIAIDLNNENVELGIGVCSDKVRRTVSKISERENAVASINFGFFNMQDPSSPAGALKYNGIVESTSDVGQGSGGIVAFTKNNFEFWRPEEFDKNKHENFRAGFPLLVYNGEIYDKIGSYDHVLQRHPRTAIGITANNILYFVAFDGRSAENAIGVSCPNLADFMQRLGCTFALNMDGGGSTVMWTKKYGVINHPSDNRKFDNAGERRVYDILFVRDNSNSVEESPHKQIDNKQTPAA